MLTNRVRNLLFFAYASFLAIFSIAFVLFIINAALADELTIHSDNGNLYLADFIQYYRDGKIATSIDHDHIYDRDVRLKWLNQLIGSHHVENPLLTQGPPLQVLLVLPLLKFSLSKAHLIWALSSLLIGLAALAILVGANWRYHPRISSLILLGTTASLPGVFALYDGQTSWFLLGMTAIYWYAWLKKRDWLAGLFLTLSIIKFQFTPFWLIPALAKKRYRIVILMLLGTVLTFVATGLLFGWQNVLDYPKTFLYIEKDTNVSTDKMITLRKFLSLFLPQQSAFFLSVLLMLFCLTFLFWLWLHVNEKDKTQVNLAIGITTLAALCLSAHVFAYDLILLSIPAILTLPNLDLSILFSSANKTRPGYLLIQAYYLVFLVYPIITILVFNFIRHYEFLVYFVLNLILLIGSVILFLKVKSREKDDIWMPALQNL
jgi:hypothetical protein